MALPEQLEQCLVIREFWIIDDEHGFGVAGKAAAHLFVGRVRRRPAGVADRGNPNTRRLPEHPLRTPEAAEAEESLFHAGGIRPRQRVAVDEMVIGYRHRLAPSRQTVLGPRD